ncbi:hypothetical protein IF1G_02083 [Cordyceps javanica]|uniref:Uncharacterized protein n=1 Tax=Cordyceps javanica TaxID=43265 RepID=A0A545VDS9_9HYPO|nr:hypothetical protein IF1G_02083 [Cordyceps javanica]
MPWWPVKKAPPLLSSSVCVSRSLQVTGVSCLSAAGFAQPCVCCCRKKRGGSGNNEQTKVIKKKERKTEKKGVSRISNYFTQPLPNQATMQCRILSTGLPSPGIFVVLYDTGGEGDGEEEEEKAKYVQSPFGGCQACNRFTFFGRTKGHNRLPDGSVSGRNHRLFFLACVRVCVCASVVAPGPGRVCCQFSGQ